MQVTKTNETPEEIKRIPLGELVRQHRTRYILHMSIGDIILKHITYLDTEETVLLIGEQVKGYLALVDEYEMLTELAKFDAGLTAAQTERLIYIGGQLEPYAKIFALKCFVEPVLTTLEELDAILSNVTIEERDALLKIMGLLTQSSGGKANVDVAVLLKNIGINLPNDLSIETITSEQAAAFVDSARPKGAV